MALFQKEVNIIITFFSLCLKSGVLVKQYNNGLSSITDFFFFSLISALAVMGSWYYIIAEPKPGDSSGVEGLSVELRLSSAESAFI